MSAGRLAEALAAHPYEHGDCGCSEYVLDVPYADHLANVVLDLLDSDETREAVANVIPLGFTSRDPYDDVNEAAEAALTAIRTYLTTPTKEEA